MSIKDKDDTSTSKIKLAISPKELEKQLGTISDKESDFSLALSESNKWFTGVNFFDLENKQLAENTEFFKVSFKVVGTNYLSDSKQQHKWGKWIVKKTTSGMKLQKPANDKEYLDASNKLKRDLTIANLLELDTQGMKDYPAKIRNYVLETRAKIKKDVWHKKMNIWKSVAFDFHHPDLASNVQKRGSNKKRELRKFLLDTLTSIMTRIDTDVIEDAKKNEDNNRLNHLYLGSKEKHNKEFSVEFKTKTGKIDRKNVSTLYSQFQQLKKQIEKNCDNDAYELPQEK